MTVDGAGSSWTNTNVLYVGDSGTGTLTIQNGGTVSSSAGSCRLQCQLDRHSDGRWRGLVLDQFPHFYIGHSGTGTLTIQNGGAVSNNNGNIGDHAGSPAP